MMGLDYGVVLQMMDLYAVGNRREAMEDLQVMEGRARELFNEEASKAAKAAQSAASKRKARRKR